MEEKINLKEITLELENILKDLIVSTKKEIEVFIDLQTEEIINNVNYKHNNMKKYTRLMEELGTQLSKREEEDILQIKTDIENIEKLIKELKYHNLKLKTIMSPVVDLYKNI